MLQDTIINGDSLEELKALPAESVDLICTDPPYGYGFMGKDWDQAVPSVELWKECLRVLKPGAFAFIMSAPRQDVLSQMIVRVGEAGFDTDFTSIYWTYASGFPKASNIGKLVDKRAGAERLRIPMSPRGISRNQTTRAREGRADILTTLPDNTPVTEEAKTLDGSYAGFQPKPAVEVIIVAMKPLSEKTFVDQALKNGRGVTWLDDARIPATPGDRTEYGVDGDEGNPTLNDYGARTRVAYVPAAAGRFPANLLSDAKVLGDHSRYFDLDAWAAKLPPEAKEAFPFLVVPKASKSEKDKGLLSFPDGQGGIKNDSGRGYSATAPNRPVIVKNVHPTVKPLKLMQYLITLGSRLGDVVLDPFSGSGTTCVAAKLLGRNYIGIDLSLEYCQIAVSRIAAHNPDNTLFQAS